MEKRERDSGVSAMLAVGGFASTPAFRRWSKTDEATPILRAWAGVYRAPDEDEFFAIDLAAEEVAERQCDALAADIELRFGDPASA